MSATENAILATKYFLDYVNIVRNPSVKGLTISQEGTDPTLKNWVSKSADLIAKTFQYPQKERQHIILYSGRYLLCICPSAFYY